MARTREEIQASVQQVLVDEMAAIGVTINPATWSKTNLLRLLCFVFAVCGRVIEVITDTTRADVIEYRTNQSPFNTRAIVRLAKAYLHGYTLDGETDKYDTSGLTDEQIQAASVIKYAACSQVLDGFGKPFLRLKMASETDGELRQLTESEMEGLTSYMAVVRPAGVKIVKESNPPDQIRMGWKVYYNPLIINAAGDRIDGTATDVGRVAIKEYLTQIVFNGIYAPQNHEVFVKQVEGIALCPIQYVQTKYAGYDWVTVNDTGTPDAGYYRFANDTDLIIEYIAYNEA